MVHMILKENQGGTIVLNGSRTKEGSLLLMIHELQRVCTCLHLLQTASINGYKDQLILKIDKEEDDDYDYQQNQNRIESEGRPRVTKTETKKQEVVDMRRFKFFHFPVELMHFNFMRRGDGMELYRRIERL